MITVIMSTYSPNNDVFIDQIRPFIHIYIIVMPEGGSPTCPEPLIGRAEEKAGNNPPCPITPTLTSSSVHHSSHQVTTTFLSYYNVT